MSVLTHHVTHHHITHHVTKRSLGTTSHSLKREQTLVQFVDFRRSKENVLSTDNISRHVGGLSFQPSLTAPPRETHFTLNVSVSVDKRQIG